MAGGYDMTVEFRVRFFLALPGLMGNVVLAADFQQRTKATFLMEVFAGVAHVAAAGEGIAVVKSPDDGFLQLVQLCDKLWREKTVVDPMDMDDVGLLYCRVMGDGFSKPLQRKRCLYCFRECFGQVAFRQDIEYCPGFLKRIFTESAGLSAFLKLEIDHDL